ncbi:hypothetical protein BDB01DRAFT_160526 [Pilobolus umbonatus]|nr:hypothetical protein BDB01DRAFT_160526 [Pilobolus umbonatus]
MSSFSEPQHSLANIVETHHEHHRPSWVKSKGSLYFVLLSVFEAIVVISLESVIFGEFQTAAFIKHTGLSSGIPVYLTIFIFSQLFQIFFAVDVRHQNTIQVIGFLIFHTCCLAYAGFQFKQMNDVFLDAVNNIVEEDQIKITLIKRLLIGVTVVIGVCEVIYAILTFILYKEFGWKIYKKIGADTDKRTMYRWYQIILTILKIDFFFFLGYSIQYLVLVLQTNDYEFALTIVALPLTVLFLVLAVYAIRYESKYMMYLFFLGIMAAMAYFIFKIIRIYTPDQAEKFRFVKAFLTFFASVSLVLVVLTLGNAIICYRNFNKGLKPALAFAARDSRLVSRNEIERELSLD